MADDREIGYGRPPKHTRFQKGQSGNPKGRPRRRPSFKADLAAELQEKLAITENGKQRKVTKQRALIKTLTAAAIKKDIRAVNALLACMRHFGVGVDEELTESVEVDDLEAIDAYIRQQRKRQSRSTSNPKPPQSNTHIKDQRDDDITKNEITKDQDGRD